MRLYGVQCTVQCTVQYSVQYSTVYRALCTGSRGWSRGDLLLSVLVRHSPRSDVTVTMCHPANYNRQLEVRRARKVVKKYRKMSLKKEMQRLRTLLNASNSLPSEEVLDRTVDLIAELETRLISQIRDRGLPDKMAGMMSQMGLQWDSSMDMMRDVVGQMMSMSSS